MTAPPDRRTANQKLTGSVMLETLIALPVVLVLGLSVVQWAYIHEARGYLDHATFMAARAGALNQAERSAMQNAFARAMTPLHIGRAESSHFETTFLTKALPDSRLNTRLEILEDPAETGLLHLKATYGYPLRVPYADWFIIQAVKTASRFSNAYDARERLMLAQRRLPMTSTAVVHMHSQLPD